MPAISFFVFGVTHCPLSGRTDPPLQLLDGVPVSASNRSTTATTHSPSSASTQTRKRGAALRSGATTRSLSSSALPSISPASPHRPVIRHKKFGHREERVLAEGDHILAVVGHGVCSTGELQSSQRLGFSVDLEKLRDQELRRQAQREEATKFFPPARLRERQRFETHVQELHEQEVDLSQSRRLLHERLHHGYGLMSYGSQAEQAQYKREIRGILLEQTRQRTQSTHDTKAADRAFYDVASAKDRADLETARVHSQQHKQRLVSFRDENIKLMEERRLATRALKTAENQDEQARLGFEPLNWSRTLT
eukprot:m.113220 g.113220  ORF g.113220 m.113220 type:complete len:308 (+) comp51862_c0_seq3:242-1165(+)